MKHWRRKSLLRRMRRTQEKLNDNIWEPSPLVRYLDMPGDSSIVDYSTIFNNKPNEKLL